MEHSSPSDSSPSDNQSKVKATSAKDLMVLILKTLQEIYYPLNVVWWKALLFFTGGIMGGLGLGYIIGALIKVYYLPAPAPAPAPEPVVTTTPITFAPPPW